MSSHFDEADFRQRAAARLHRSPVEKARFSDDDLNPEARIIPPGITLKPAAVLVPVVVSDNGLNLLLTQRTPHLKRHAGQVAFPGGRVDEGDADAVAAALRETEEETGIAPSFVETLGFLDTYLTGTAYRVTPVVGMLKRGFSLVPHTGEVADIFEVPLEFLMNPAHHLKHSREFQGRERFYYAMPFEGRYIWGATAGMIRNFYMLLYHSA